MKPKTLIIIVLILAAALVVIFGWRPTSAAFQKIVYNIQLGNGLVGYWSFNGNYIDWSQTSAEARDSSGQGNHGNIINFGQEAVRLGVSGQALSFDGADDRVTLTNAIMGNDYTYSAWVKLKALPANESYMVLFNSGNVANGDQSLGIINNYANSNGWVLASYSDVSSDNANEGSLTAQTDTWYFIVGVRNSADDSARVYVNGSQVAVDSNLTSPTALYGSTGVSTNIGMRVGGTYFFNGIIDEVRVYNRALSVAEINYLYERTAPDIVKGSIKSPNSNGLVGFWNFDDCDICTTANDMSGNGNTGTITDANNSGLRNRVVGKINNALNFDGTDDYVSVADSNSLDLTNNLTISFWLFLDAYDPVSDVLVGKHNSAGAEPDTGYIFGIYQNKLLMQFGDGGGGWPASGTLQSNTAVPTGAWTHIVATKSGTQVIFYLNGQIDATVTASASSIAANTRDLWIGGNVDAAGSLVDGLIDEVRIYNRALSAAEVKGLYEETKRVFINMPQNDQLTDGLVGMWSFNGPDMNWALSTAEARDSSGGGNHGDVINFGQSAARPGIVGQALSFDSSNDGVTLAANTFSNAAITKGTVSLWFRANNFNPSDYNCLFNLEGILYVCPNNGIMKMFVTVAAGEFSVGSTLSTATWYHVALTWNGITDSKAYINGVETASQAAGSPNPDSVSRATGIGIGWDGSSYPFNGLIDEVRIYNRDLSAAEVTRLYNAGRRE